MANVGTAAAGKTLIGTGSGASPTFASIGTNSALSTHGLVLAQGNSPFISLTPSATVGLALTSNGVGSDPSYNILSVSGGGTGNNSFTAYSVITAGTTSTGAFQNVSGVGTSGQLLTSAGAGALPTWTTVVTTTTWTDQASPFTASSNNGYFATAALAATLPAAPAQGDIVSIVCDTTGAVVVTANTGQFIRLGTSISASAGNATSSARGDAIELVYRTSGTTWIAKNSPTGAWSVT